MYKHGDYSSYINSLRYKSLYSVCCQKPNCYDNNCHKPKTGCTVSSESIYNDTDIYSQPITITTNTCITYLEPQLDVITKPRIYNLEANPNISNGTSKIIVNNIDISGNVFVQLNCVNSYNQGGFVIYNKRYKSYLFGIKGEPFELLWNQTLSGWSVLQYSNRFKE
jgi:hypothetical protein